MTTADHDPRRLKDSSCAATIDGPYRAPSDDRWIDFYQRMQRLSAKPGVPAAAPRSVYWPRLHRCH